MPALLKNNTPDPTADETRARLLDAAGQVFAERGFRAATVREICKLAGANVAAIHYHFGDKESLYTIVLKDSYKAALQKYPPLLDIPANAPPRERLRAFIRSILFRVFDDGRPAWHGKLMLREMTEPTHALDELVRNGIRPLFEMLQSIVRELAREAEPKTSPSTKLVIAGARSIVGQCTFYKFTQPVIERLTPDQSFDRETVEEIADHITEFSIHGIVATAKRARRERE